MKCPVVHFFLLIHFVVDSLEDIVEYQSSSFKLDKETPKDFLHYLQCKPLVQRRALCNEILPQLKEVRPLNQHIGDKEYVPKALQYDDSGTKKIAIRCPTLPAVYIHATPSESGDQYNYNAITVLPSNIIESFDFVVETAHKITLVENNPLSEQILAQTKSQFYFLEAEELWYLCNRAMNAIEYAYHDIDWLNEPIGQPNLYNIGYRFWNINDIAVSCPTTLPIYLRAGNSAQDKMITIILLRKMKGRASSSSVLQKTEENY